MTRNQAFSLFQHGKFEKAIDHIEDELTNIDQDDEQYVQLIKLQSRAYYHMGSGDQALYVIEQLEQQYQDLETTSNRAIYEFGQGEIEKARKGLSQITIDDSENFAGLSSYYFATGQLHEFDGLLTEAKTAFQRSLTYRQKLDDQYEANVIYYKLATIERQQGNLTNAREYLKQSLELSTQLDLVTEMATTSTLLGQDRLLQTEYDAAVPYLEDGVKLWREQGSPFGIVWALAELAIVNFLSGNEDTALQQYKEIITIAREVMPPLPLATHLFNAIRFAITTDDYVTAQTLLDELEKIATTEDNETISARYNLASFLVNQRDQRIGTRLQQFKQLDELHQNSIEAVISYQALIETIKLLLLEYTITEDQLFKEQILNEADDRIEELLAYIHQQMSISFEVHTAILRSKIESLRYNPNIAQDIIQQIREHTGEIDPTTINKELEQIEENLSEENTQLPDFDFKKEFQSIPTLKIMLYLLPRQFATFSELEAGSGLSAGHLSGKAKKLEELDLIVSEKRFVNENQVTIFRISSAGYIQLKKYMRELSKYLDQVF